MIVSDNVPSTLGDTEKGGGLSHISAVANYFIECSKNEKISLSNLSIQKLSYFAYGWIIVAEDEKLFYDRIEAWQYGPVIPSLYHQLKQFGRERITKKIMDYDFYEDKFYYWKLKADTPAEILIRKAWNYYKSLSPRKMIDLTHDCGTPWRQTVLEKGFNAEIDDRLIKDHFSEKLFDMGVLKNHE